MPDQHPDGGHSPDPAQPPAGRNDQPDGGYRPDGDYRPDLRKREGPASGQYPPQFAAPEQGPAAQPYPASHQRIPGQPAPGQQPYPGQPPSPGQQYPGQRPPGGSGGRVALIVGLVAAAVTVVLVLGLVALVALRRTTDDGAGGRPDRPGQAETAPEGSSGSLGQHGTLSGSGSSAVEAAMTAWIAGFQEANPDAVVNYIPIGSGAGRENLLSGAVQFAATDQPLTELEQAQAQAVCGVDGAMSLPIRATSIGVGYNLPTVPELRLDGPTTARVFSGQITTWNDPAITALNPGASLPATPITVVHRSDEAAGTQVFTSYLATAAPADWPHEPDRAWPIAQGEAAAQTSGLVAVLASTPGSIGYADTSALGGLQVAALDVGGGHFLAPTPEDVAARVDAAPRISRGGSGDLALDLTAASGGYPIVQLSYAIVCTEYPDEQTADLVRGFLGHVISEPGQQEGAQYAGSAPLSAAMRGRVETSLGLIRGD